MNKNRQTRLSQSVLLALSLITCTASNAWHGNGAYYHGHGGYHHGGGYYGHHHGSWGFGGPNVIINVPPNIYYSRPYCETIRVCNPYNECWFEKHCD